MEPKVSAVIVTYNNAGGLANILVSLRAQTFRINEIVIVDNASTDNTGSLIKEKYPEVTYMLMSENLGSAGGYYDGIKHASSKNDLIWALDDDLNIFPDTLLKLVEGFKHLATTGKIGAVRCTVKPNNDSYFEDDGFAWRGTLINSEAVREIGYPNKDYYLYAEDMEYSMRMHKAGYKIFYVTASKMAFTRPNQTVYKAYGLKVSFYNDPVRLYYAIRNSAATYIKYRLFVRLFFLMGYISKILVCLVKFPTIERGKFFSAILRGFFDGITFKLGKNNDFTPKPA